MAKKEKEEAVESSSNDAMADLLIKHKEDHFNHITPKHKVISTGSLLLDSRLKVRSGQVVRLVGKGAELGKTSQCFVFARNYMDVMPKSRTLFIKAESRLSEEMMARSGHTFVTDPADWKAGTIFIFATNVFETIADTIQQMLKAMYAKGEHLCIVLDSLDGVILKDDKDKQMDGNAKVAGVPLLTKLLFRHIALPVNHYDALLLVTGQYSAAISLDPYKAVVPRQAESSGGSSIAHQSDYVLSYGNRYQGDNILEKPKDKPDYQTNKTLGVYATVEIKKSATDNSGDKLKIPIKKGRVGNAIWREKEVVDVALAFAQLTGKGAWFDFNVDLIAEAAKDGIEIKAKHQGINAVYEYVETDVKVFGWLYNRFNTLFT